MKRILFLDHAPVVGGAELALVGHLRQLDRAAFDPHVACGDAHPRFVEELRSTGATVHVFDWPRLKHLTPARAMAIPETLRAFRQLVQAVDPALVVANTSRTAYTMALARLSRPQAWCVRDFDFNRRLLRIASRRAKRIICVSEAIRAYYGKPGDDRFVVELVASDLHRLLPAVDRDRVRVERSRWGFSDADLVVGYMGRLVRGKGPEDLIEAFQIAHARNPRLRLLIVGVGKGQDGGVEELIHARVRDAGLADLVRFAGFQRDEALYYSLFDIFILSSRYREALPTSVIQALMAGKPVIATATGGTPEVVLHEQTGLLVPPNDPRAMAAALQRIIDQPALAARLARDGQSRVLERHREDVTTGRLERLYESITAEPARRAS